MHARICAAIESVALALWVGALAGFAFVFAPVTFHETAELGRFAALVNAMIVSLTGFGYACGAIAILAILGRAAVVRGRLPEIVRALLVAFMLAVSTFEVRVILPEMQATLRHIDRPLESLPRTDPLRVKYDDQHRNSSAVYGTVLALGLVTIVLGALRPTRAEAPTHRRRATDRR